jgi:hypothetical protein
MIARIVLACVVGAVTFLVCILVGGLLGSIGIPFIAVVGAFLVQWAPVIGLLAALWYFFAGGSFSIPRRT